MSDVDAISVLLGAVTLVLVWRPRLTPQTSNALTQQKFDLSDSVFFLNQLQSRLVVSQDLDSAMHAIGQIHQAGYQSAKLEQLLRAVQSHGIPAGPAISFLANAETLRTQRIARWEEKSSAARVSSWLLAVLPIATWAVAQGSGLQIFNWLRTGVGVLCFSVYAVITLLSGLILRGMRQRATQPRPSRRSEISETTISWLAAAAIFSWHPTAPMLLVSVVVAGVIRMKWSGWSQQSTHRRNQMSGEERAWSAVLIAAGLSAGLTWADAVELCLESTSDVELNAVSQRLAWGIEPIDAFGDIENWSELQVLLNESAITGAPVVNGLQNLAVHWQMQVHQLFLEDVERIAARAILPVSLLQLPAFIAAGLFPVLWLSLSPMLRLISTA